MPSDPVIVSLRQQLKRANDKLLPLKAKLKEQAIFNKNTPTIYH